MTTDEGAKIGRDDVPSQAYISEREKKVNFFWLTPLVENYNQKSFLYL